jgi:hypothetical protein
MLRRFIRDPEFAGSYSEARDYRAIGSFDAKEFGGAECGFVELDRLRASADREHGGDGRGRGWIGHLNMLANEQRSALVAVLSQSGMT